MSTTRMTAAMRRSLEIRLQALDRRIATHDTQREGDDSLESTVLLEDLKRERGDVADALRDGTLIDNEPFDTKAIEIGDTVTIRDPEGETERYVLVDGNLRSRAQSDWVSVSSPLGAALLGRSKGEHVDVESPGGTASYAIVDFERASDHAVLVAVAGDGAPRRGRRALPSDVFIG